MLLEYSDFTVQCTDLNGYKLTFQPEHSARWLNTLSYAIKKPRGCEANNI
jgi:hypothetical protein